MTFLVQELPEHLQARITPEEQVLWCGKGRPVAWFDGAIGQCVIGVVVLAFLCFFGSVVISATDFESVSLVGKVMPVVFFAVFGLIDISLLFAPLWHWCATRRAVWVITDRRVLCFRGRSCDEWKESALVEEPEWEFLYDDGGRDFVFGQHRVSSRHGSHWEHDRIESVPPEDVARVEAALLRLAECRKAREAAALPGEIAEVSGRFTVLHDSDGSIRIIYRKNRPVLGAVMLAAAVGFLALMVTLLVRAGDTPIPIYLLFVPILLLACWPFLYEIFGRREIALAAGSGRYFNGIGRIGFSRTFTYDSHTLVHEGRTIYQVNGRNHYAVLLRASGRETSQTILAHGEEAVAKEFIRYLKQAIRQEHYKSRFDEDSSHCRVYRSIKMNYGT